MHLGDRGPKWQEESPQSRRMRPHPPQTGVRHMVTYLREQKIRLYIWEERGEGKSHHMGAL